MLVSRPLVVYGTAWKKSDTARLVEAALRLGFRAIDTACQPRHYDEAGVGAGVDAWLSGAGSSLGRAQLYLQSKFSPSSGQDPGSIPYDPRAPLEEQVAQSCAASLRNLQTEYLDCLLLHSPLERLERTLEAWRAMESLMDAGTVRALGISNCYSLAELTALHAAARIKPQVVQNRFYAETGYDRDIRAYCRQRRMVYQSFWTLTANPQVLAHPTTTHLAREHRRTAQQILFRYLSQCGVVPLTGTRSEAHMRDDLAIAEFELTERELEAMDALL